MANQKPKFTNVVDTQMFGDDRRRYYFDIKKAKNERHFLQITNHKLDADETYRRTHVILFEEDLAMFVEAITMLLGRYATGNLGISC